MADFMIRILTVTTSGLSGREGISTILFDYFSRFDKKKFQLDMIASGEYSRELVCRFQEAGVSIYFLPSRQKELIPYMAACLKLMKKQKYDALYIHGSSAIMSIELFLAKLCGCKARIVHSHNTTCSHKKADRLLRPFFYRLYTSALACSEKAGRWLYGNRKFEVIRNGRNVEIYAYSSEIREKMRKQLQIPEHTFVIGHVGYFSAEKNQSFLVRVFKELQERIPNSKLYFIGAGSGQNEVKALVQQLGLEDDVVFTGSISNVPEMLQAMDVMVLPSLHEGLPLVSVEWQMAGLPCLLSDSITRECAYTDLVSFMPLDTGYVEWAKKIMEISNGDRASASAEAASLAPEKGFDLDSNVKKLQKFFEACV